MQPSELERYLHEHIPLSSAMSVSVVSVSRDSIILQAPLAPNINHRETVFGGSASALAILASWSLLHTRMRDENIDGRLVIQRNTMEYLQPIDGEFRAVSALEHADDWQQFIRIFKRKGKARISAVSVLEYAGTAAGRFSGEFVALGAGTVS